jgi:hypothetical protein
MTFAQRQNRLTTHFPERNPVGKRRMTATPNTTVQAPFRKAVQWGVEVILVHLVTRDTGQATNYKLMGWYWIPAGEVQVIAF